MCTELAANVAAPDGDPLPNDPDPPTLGRAAVGTGARARLRERRLGATDTDIWVPARPGACPPVPLTDDLATDGHPAVSPDGKWVRV